jgi:hypothetical protein
MKNKKVYVIFIGTQKYSNFFEMWYNGIKDHLFVDCEKTILAFSDLVDSREIFNKPDVIKFKIPHLPWPFVTLSRFEFIKKALEKLGDSNDASHLLFLDADLIPVANKSFKDIFGTRSKKFVAVHHPAQAENHSWNSFVKTGLSTSKIDIDTTNMLYRQGCLWGGEMEAVKEMLEECVKNIEIDKKNGVMADWHDESHMNYWFAKNDSQVYTLDATYAWPAAPRWTKTMASLGFSKPSMVHLDKPHSIFPRFQGGNNNTVDFDIIKIENE